QNKSNKHYNLLTPPALHLHPFPIYSNKYKSLKHIPNRPTIIITNNLPQHRPILPLLQNPPLINLHPNLHTINPTVNNI
ncbi:MetQ/NlpA family ABC transporter substrate-binding protein, partial [Bacillus sp. WP8]|uniref:MetQ/NlpA family ABC transporter substrate-binding protein n=1 Tax=Bacillus sp. WP8 TaxID=756828 RepID=UPI0037BE39EF